MKLFIALVTSFVVAVPGIALAQDVPPAEAPPAEAPAEAADAQESATHAAKTAGCPVAGTVAGQAPAQAAPLKDGVAEECAGYAQEITDPKLYLCDVTGAVQQGFAENGGEAVAEQIGTVRSTAGIDQCGVDSTCVNNCSPGKTRTDGPDGGGPSVQALNAAPDGGLPRTGGGELLAGFGFVLSSVGAVLRRFLG